MTVFTRDTPPARNLSPEELHRSRKIVYSVIARLCEMAGGPGFKFRWPKDLLLTLVALSLSGCAYHNAGVRVYAPITRVDSKGNTYQRMALKSEISADLPGLSTLEMEGVKLVFRKGTTTTQSPTYDRKGNVTNIISVSSPNGFYTSHVIRAQGDAFAKGIDSGAAAATGVLVTIGSSVVTGGAAAALIP